MKLLILFKQKYNVGDVVYWNGCYRVVQRNGYKHWLEKIEDLTMKGAASVNLSTGNQRLCPVCKGLKTLAETSYSPSGTCYCCNGTGRIQPLTGVDAQGLPPNNMGTSK